MTAMQNRPQKAAGSHHRVFSRMTAGEKTFDIINILVMGLFSVIILYPVLNVAAVSLSSDFYIYSGQVGMLPKGFNIFVNGNVVNYLGEADCRLPKLTNSKLYAYEIENDGNLPEVQIIEMFVDGIIGGGVLDYIEISINKEMQSSNLI